MQSIGERLEEARKRRGISVREAAEGTKIRGDFLVGFENNQFETGLPDLYVRGFLRNYAQFLKADAEKIVTDYNALVIGETKSARKENRELFGRLELPEQRRSAPESTGTVVQPERKRTDEPGERRREPLSPEMLNYIKIGAIALAAVLGLLLTIWLVLKLVGGSSEESPGSAVDTQTEEQPLPMETVTLIAVGNVHVRVKQTSGDERVLFSGPLARGETREVAKRGQILIEYNVGRNLQIEKDGQRYQMPQDGIGRSSFD